MATIKVEDLQAGQDILWNGVSTKVESVESCGPWVYLYKNGERFVRLKRGATVYIPEDNYISGNYRIL